MFKLRGINHESAKLLFFKTMKAVSITNAVLFPAIAIHSYEDFYEDKIKSDPAICISSLFLHSAVGALSGFLFPVALPVTALHLYVNDGKFNFDPTFSLYEH